MAKVGLKPVWNQLETFRKLKWNLRKIATVSLIGDLLFFLFSLFFIVSYALFTENSESLCQLTTMISLFKLAYFLNHANLYAPFFDIVERDISRMQTIHRILMIAVQFVCIFEIAMVLYIQYIMPVDNMRIPISQTLFAFTQCLFSMALNRAINLSLEELFTFMSGPGTTPRHIPIPAPTPDVQVIPQIIVVTID
ncbi:hypothetical protein CAEBREN_25936 [Caenorhabditis brenneri]|uniref:Uncharacterized protein n=1 Tax=Caenorhabditis brenneri TaxID=135651 RepID=G0MW60_CAEBE|nr:hypothetical protein CAEBREN_25936 [Caenorhabditis brenneri]